MGFKLFGFRRVGLLATCVMLTAACSSAQPEADASQVALRLATFNVSMEADNYLAEGERGDQQVLIERLATGEEPQIRHIAEIIQRTRPDIILLTEFDYIDDPAQGVEAFIRNYLQQPQGGQATIDYPHYYYAPVNTGQPSPFDLDRSGEATGTGADAWGFGKYPGQYGMLLLSKYPIDIPNIRTFQHFLWRDMPGYSVTRTADGDLWYSPEAWAQFPLSSKSHWDVPVWVGTQRVHVLASHPTPPVFDGPENRNGHRNFDEIRFWLDYIQGADYMYDDVGVHGGLAPATRFVIMGDLNASPDEGDARRDGIANLLASDYVQGDITPTSEGAVAHSQDLVQRGERELAHVAAHTASWRMRADYVIPSRCGLEVIDAGVFWPPKGAPGYALVASRGASSDHRLVWVDTQISAGCE